MACTLFLQGQEDLWGATRKTGIHEDWSYPPDKKGIHVAERDGDDRRPGLFTHGPFPREKYERMPETVFMHQRPPLSTGTISITMPSMSAFTSFKSRGIGRCWGHAFSHFPHARQSPAFEGLFRSPPWWPMY